MTLYTLDTNAVTALLKANPYTISKTKQVVPDSVISLNAMCYFEIKRGLVLPAYAKKYRQFQKIVRDWSVLPIGLDVMDEAARIYQHLRQQGTLLEDADILIAATAITHDATLVTRNTRHFARVPGLKLENWETPNP